MTSNNTSFIAWLSTQTDRSDLTGEVARIFNHETVLEPVAQLLDSVITEWADTVHTQQTKHESTVVQTMGTVEEGATVIGINRRSRRRTEGEA